MELLDLIFRTDRPAGDLNDLTPAEIDGNFKKLRNALKILGLGYISLANPVYGFSSTAGAAENSAAIRAAALEATADGGSKKIYFPAGDYNINPVELVGVREVLGAGADDCYGLVSGTRLNYAGNGDLITMSTPGFVFREIALRHTGNNVTAGSGLKIDIRGTHPTAPQLFPSGVGSNFTLRDCSFDSFYVNINILNAFEWVIDSCLSQNSRQAGLRIASQQLADGGDGAISNCQFLSAKYAGGYGILWNSSGGVKVSNTKFNLGRHANNGLFSNPIRIEPDTTSYNPNVQSTSVIFGVGSGVSIENFTGAAVYAANLKSVSVLGTLETCAYRDIAAFFYFTGCTSASLGWNPVVKSNTNLGQGCVAEFHDCSNCDVYPNPGDAAWSKPYVLSGTSTAGMGLNDVRVYTFGAAMAPTTAPTTAAPAGSPTPAGTTIDNTATTAPNLLYTNPGVAGDLAENWKETMAGQTSGSSQYCVVTEASQAIRVASFTSNSGSFTGTGFDYYSILSPNGCNAVIKVDGQAVQTVSLNTSNNSLVAGYEDTRKVASVRVEPGTHTFSIEADLTGSPGSGELYVDKLVFV